MSNRDADFSTWIERNPPPSLAEMLKKHGSYGAIPSTPGRSSRLTTRIGRSGAKRVCAENKSPDHFAAGAEVLKGYRNPVILPRMAPGSQRHLTLRQPKAPTTLAANTT